MSNNELIMDLAKLMIAAAWADGELSNDEINALKDLLFTIEDLPAKDWNLLEMYMDSPVTEEETQELIKRIVAGINNKDDKEMVIGRLRSLFEADSKVTPKEAALLEEIESSAAGSANVFAVFSKAFRSAISLRIDNTKATCLRETSLEDYIKNTVYYQLQMEQKQSGIQINLGVATLGR